MVEFEQKFNNESLNALNQHQLKKNKKTIYSISSFFVVFSVLFLLEKFYYVAAGLFIFAIVFIFLTSTKKSNMDFEKSMPTVSEETNQVFQFDNDDYTVITTKGENYKAVTKASYKYVFKVEENQTHIFVFIAENQSFIIKKSNITKGSLEELYKIFKKNISSDKLFLSTEKNQQN